MFELSIFGQGKERHKRGAILGMMLTSLLVGMWIWTLTFNERAHDYGHLFMDDRLFPALVEAVGRVKAETTKEKRN